MAALLILLLAPAGASGESVVYIRDHTPWVMNLDGSGQRSLGLFASYASSFYTSAAMADDGTVLAALTVQSNCGPGDIPSYPPAYYCDRGDRVIKVAGGAASDLGKPLPCGRALSHLDVSPDGKLMAFEFGLPTAENCAPEGAPTTGVAIAEAKPGGAVLSFVGRCRTPAFIDNARVAVGCYQGTSGIHVITPGQNASSLWVETQNSPGFPAVSRDFSHIAWTPEAYTRDNLYVWSLAGPPPAQPTAGCTASSDKRFTGPSWASDNQTIVYSLGDDLPGSAPGPGEGVFAITEPNPASQCAGAVRSLDPLGENPDVGGSSGNPSAAPPPPPSAAPGPPSLGPSSGPGALQLTAAFKSRQPLRPVLTSGLRASVGCNRTCSVGVEVRPPASVARKLKLKPVVAKHSIALDRGTTQKVTIRFTTSARKKLARLKSVKLTVTFTATDSERKTTTKSLPLTLRRAG